MLSGCFGDGSYDLVRARDVMRDIDVDNLATPGLRWRDSPNEEREKPACQHGNLSFADAFTDSGGYISAWGPDRWGWRSQKVDEDDREVEDEDEDEDEVLEGSSKVAIDGCEGVARSWATSRRKDLSPAT